MAFLAAIPAAFAAIGAGTATAAETALVLGTVATGAATVAGGVGAYSAYKSNMFQSAIAKNNAAIAKQNETISQEQGAQQESLVREDTTRHEAAQLAAQGASGVDVGFGSPLAVRQATANVGKFDAQNVRYNALMRSLGYTQQANSDLISAKQSEQAAVLDASGKALATAGSFLSSGSSLASKWATMQKGGA